MPTHDYSRKWIALIGLSLLSFTAFIDYTIVTTALPFIQKDLHASVLELQWVMNIFSMILSMFMIFAGKAGDLWGRKPVFFLGFILFGIAALGAGYAPSIHWLIFFRGIQGLAGSIIFTVGVALLPQAFPENEQERAIGVFSAFNGLGLAIGPFASGLLISLFSWRWVFWINIPIILLGSVMCAFTLAPSPPPQTRTKIDWLGLLLLAISVGSLVYGLIAGGQAGWDLISTWVYISIGLLAAILLVYVEMHVKEPLLDLSLFSNHYAALAMLLCISAGLITSVFMFFDPLYLEAILNYSAFAIGIILLSIPIVQVLVSIIFEKLDKLVNIKKLIIIALFTGFIAALCHMLFSAYTSLFFIIIAMMLMGYTWGMANVGSIAALAKSVRASHMGNAIGTVFTFWNLSTAIFLAIASILFHWRTVDKLVYETSHLSIPLTVSESAQLNNMLADPAHARAQLQLFTGKIGQTLQAIYNDSFMDGFRWAAGFSAVIMLVVLVLGLSLYRNNKS